MQLLVDKIPTADFLHRNGRCVKLNSLYRIDMGKESHPSYPMRGCETLSLPYMAGMRKGRKRNVKEGNVKEGNQGNYLTLRLGEKILIERKKSGLSQGQLADMLGVTRQSVSKWESGVSQTKGY